MEQKAVKLVEALTAMQEEGTLCDVTLQAEQKTLTAHKVVLAAGSPYFMAMFNGNFKETESKVVTFQEVRFSGLKAVVNDIYFKTVEIPVENIPNVLPAAHLFQMENLLDSICTLMTDNIHTDNFFQFLEIAQKYQLKREVEVIGRWMADNATINTCFQYLELAQKYHMEHAIGGIHEFILNNFKKVSADEEFYNTSQEDFCGYLSSDLLRTEFQEIDVYMAAKKWLEINKVKDTNTITDIMKNVRFALIKSERLSEIIHDDVLCANEEGQNMVEEAIEYQSNVYMQPLYSGILNKPRGMTGLVMFPSCSSRYEQHDIQFIRFPGYCWWKRGRRSKIFPVTDLVPEYSSINIVNVSNSLFVFGVGVNSNNYQNFTKRYDATTDTWLDMSPIPRHPILDVATAHCGQNIFLIGGCAVDIGEYEDKEDTNVNDTYMYAIPSNTWTKCENLPGKYYNSGACHLNGYIYCNGGNVTPCVKTNKHYAYDIEEKKWLVKNSMQYERSFHVFEALNVKLYAMGGASQSFENSVETYDPLADQWTEVTCSTNLGWRNRDFQWELYYRCSASFVCDSQLYLVGGHEGGLIVEFRINEDFEGIFEDIEYRSSGDHSSDDTRTVACAFMTLPKLLSTSE